MVGYRQVAAWTIVLCIAGCSSKESPSAAGSSGGGDSPVVEVQPDGGEWQPFRFEEGGYSVLMPGEPTKMPSSSDAEVSYAVELEEGGAYVVMYSEVGQIKPEELEQRLMNVRNDTVGKQKVLHDEATRVGDRPARDFAFIDADGDAHYYRVFVAGNRLYQVMTITNESKFSTMKGDREKFLNSFQLLDSQ